MALSSARAAPEPPLSYDNFYGGGYKCLQSNKIGNTGTKIMSGQNKEKSGHQFGAAPKLNGSARYYRAFMLFVPTGTILEIAPGFGRWTTYLKKYCETLSLGRRATSSPGKLALD